MVLGRPVIRTLQDSQAADFSCLEFQDFKTWLTNDISE